MIPFHGRRVEEKLGYTVDTFAVERVRLSGVDLLGSGKLIRLAVDRNL
ncbi:MAG: hypothetical protein ACPGFB_12515 [Verrucomicrobiales bacterium]